MSKYQRYPLPAYKSCTATFIYSIKVIPKVVESLSKKGLSRSKSLYNLHEHKK